jgi:hypothetical protein
MHLELDPARVQASPCLFWSRPAHGSSGDAARAGPWHLGPVQASGGLGRGRDTMASLGFGSGLRDLELWAGRAALHWLGGDLSLPFACFPTASGDVRGAARHGAAPVGLFWLPWVWPAGTLAGSMLCPRKHRKASATAGDDDVYGCRSPPWRRGHDALLAASCRPRCTICCSADLRVPRGPPRNLYSSIPCVSL